MSRSMEAAGIVLITVPAVEFGGLTLLRYVGRWVPGYADNELRRSLWRAGHAHAGVLVIFALVGLLYVDIAGIEGARATLTHSCLVIPPIAMPLGFFLSMASPKAERPNRWIVLVPLGAVALAIGAISLGLALVAG